MTAQPAFVNRTELRTEFVLPGQVRASSQPVTYSTILGSCVSICLFDPKAGCGGINHYVFPGIPGRFDPDPLRWAEPAVESLFFRLVSAGADVKNLQAKVFGGAQLGEPSPVKAFRMGERNLEYALGELKRRNVPIIAQSVGGGSGRKIIFEAHTGRTWVKDLVREGK